MYKLFLTFRYLTRKKIVLFPILVVWLCVMMLIIVTSIMGGFVERVRDANRELFGDIIISSRISTRGWSGYDDLRTELAKKFHIAASTPVVSAYALIYSPQSGQTRPTLLVGVKPEERSQVANFRESLYLNYRSPTEAIEDLSPRLPATNDQLVEFAGGKVKAAADEDNLAFDAYIATVRPGVIITPKIAALWTIGFLPLGLLVAWQILSARRNRKPLGYIAAGITLLIGAGIITIGMCWPLIFPRDASLAKDRRERSDLDLRRTQRTHFYASALPPGTYKTTDQLAAALIRKTASFEVPPDIMRDPNAPHDGCIVGSQILFGRDKRGNFIHPIYPDYQKVIMTVFPLNKKTGNINAGMENAVQRAFTIVDDSHTGVYDIDSFNVYAPFDVVQQLAGMAPDPELVKADPTAAFPAQCQELLIKLKGNLSPADLKNQCILIDDFVRGYQAAHPDMFDWPLDVQTWDEKQAKYLGAVENEKVMMTFILLLMSGVVIIVIFLIFYQIVRDKTRDIGIIKAVGGSEEGVAGIFLTYGLFVGIVGGGLGILSGVAFVTHTNEIHEWIYQMTGIIIWDRSVYLFDRIPDKVYSSDVIIYFSVALIAGVLGALIPAIIAGSEDPVKAVRYE